jgi:hypothetical protein
MSFYYTGTFKDKSTAKIAQAGSRIKGLPAVLEELHSHASAWSSWEASGYRDTIVRSAADLIADEIDRLARKKYTCESEFWQNISYAATAGGDDSSSSSGSGTAVPQLRSMAAELKKTLRYEVSLKLLFPTLVPI